MSNRKFVFQALINALLFSQCFGVTVIGQIVDQFNVPVKQALVSVVDKDIKVGSDAQGLFALTWNNEQNQIKKNYPEKELDINYLSTSPSVYNILGEYIDMHKNASLGNQIVILKMNDNMTMKGLSWSIINNKKESFAVENAKTAGLLKRQKSVSDLNQIELKICAEGYFDQTVSVEPDPNTDSAIIVIILKNINYYDTLNNPVGWIKQDTISYCGKICVVYIETDPEISKYIIDQSGNRIELNEYFALNNCDTIKEYCGKLGVILCDSVKNTVCSECKEKVVIESDSNLMNPDSCISTIERLLARQIEFEELSYKLHACSLSYSEISLIKNEECILTMTKDFSGIKPPITVLHSNEP
ncbi:MAG: hypothetical protein GF401_09525 [Chitinivibrionales bacterium]|nr:hypothetical protein [Chitinivibrionales bacterium]